jgi:RHS repeat-associated protein
MRTGGSDFYVAHDALGSVVAPTSQAGATESLFTYDPFGTPRTTTNVDPGAPSISLRFESQYLDPTGLYQLRARFMTPATGTFLSPDPLTEPAMSPAVSLYLYAADQPSVQWDPSGLCGEANQEFNNALADAYAYYGNEQSILHYSVDTGITFYSSYLTGNVPNPVDLTKSVVGLYSTAGGFQSENH